MRMPMKDLPVKTSVFTEKAPIKIWGTSMGGMLIAVHHFYPGTDVTPLLQLFPDSLCPVPHWGFPRCTWEMAEFTWWVPTDISSTRRPV